MLFLSADDCRQLLDTAAILEGVEDALRMDYGGAVRWSSPPDIRLRGGSGQTRVRVKAGGLSGEGCAGIRVLVFPDQHPETRWVIVFDDSTGEPRAIIDEAWTYPRRAIASVALIAHAVRPSEICQVGLVGAGRIARAALPFVGHLFPGAAVAMCSRRPGPVHDLVNVARDRLGLDARAVTVERAVRGSQIVFACTSATSAVLEDAWVEPGTVVGSMETLECGPDFFARADLRIVDSLEQLEDELTGAFGPGAPARIDATMSEVIAGTHPARAREEDRILVLSQGLVSQDLVLAARAYRSAMARGIGTRLPIGPVAGRAVGPVVAPEVRSLP